MADGHPYGVRRRDGRRAADCRPYGCGGVTIHCPLSIFKCPFASHCGVRGNIKNAASEEAALCAVWRLGQLSEVLDGADHLRNIGVLVVVPGNDLNLNLAVGQLGNHGLSSIKQGTKPNKRR